MGSLRSGMISLRNLHLTKPMLEILRSDEVDISLRLEVDARPDESIDGRRTVHSAAANDFMDVCARVVNNTSAFFFAL